MNTAPEFGDFTLPTRDRFRGEVARGGVVALALDVVFIGDSGRFSRGVVALDLDAVLMGDRGRFLVDIPGDTDRGVPRWVRGVVIFLVLRFDALDVIDLAVDALSAVVGLDDETFPPRLFRLFNATFFFNCGRPECDVIDSSS